ncbi:MAG: hypothetical protein ACYTGR_17400, partial [Planctomycetota bacterium]
DGRGGTALMAAGCLHCDAESAVRSLEHSLLSVRVLDLESLAMARACAPALKMSQGLVFLLDMSWGPPLFVATLGGQVVYERALPSAGLDTALLSLMQQFELSLPEVRELATEVGIGGRGGDARLAERLDTLFSEHLRAMQEELASSIAYVEHRYPGTPGETMLQVGLGSTIPGLGQKLSAMLGVPVTNARLGELWTCPADARRTCASGELAIAAGLARSEASGG